MGARQGRAGDVTSPLSSPEPARVPPSIAITIIVLVDRDRADLGPWHERLEAVLDEVGLPYEIIYVVSDRAPLATVEIESRRRSGGRVRTLLLSHWFDEAAAIERAGGLARGDLIAILPAAAEVALDDLPCLVRELRACDLVLARRAGPLEGAIYRRAAGAIDRMARRLFGIPLSDPACRTRALCRDALASVGDRSVPYPLMPLFAAWQGLLVREVEVSAAAPPRRPLVRCVALAIGMPFLYLLLSFTKRPLQLFGLAGAAALVAGLALTLAMVAARLFLGEALADQSALIPGLLLCALGLQCAVVGLVAELLIFARNRALEDYVVERMVD
jgi:hypothetical protein